MFLRYALRTRPVAISRIATPGLQFVRGFKASAIARNEDLSTPEAKQNRIISILTEKFQPEDLQVQDISGMYRLLSRWMWIFLCHSS